jgi:hypothetical protein
LEDKIRRIEEKLMRPEPALSRRPTLEESKEYVRRLTRWIGVGFHPDTPFEDYVKPDGSPLFIKTQCARLEREFARAHRIITAAGIDVCSVALPIQRRMIREAYRKGTNSVGARRSNRFSPTA